MTAKQPILTGKRIVLRPPLPSDKADRQVYGRDPEYRRMVGGDPYTAPPLTIAEIDAWYERTGADPLSWIIAVEGRCIGGARLHSLDEENRRARYVIGIFDPASWGCGYGTEATRLVLDYAFTQMKLHRVDLRVLSFNPRAIRCYEKCGFVQEGIEREGALIGGEWQTDIIMSILEQEYHANLSSNTAKL